MMPGTKLDAVIDAAIARGLLPPGTLAVDAAGRPWPLVLLTALGAWLAAIPLLLAFGMLFGDWVVRDTGGYVFGILMLVAATVVLRAQGLPHFVEQLALPILLTGAGLLAVRLFDALPKALAELLLAGIALGLAAAIPRVWLRQLMGATAALLFALACGGGDADFAAWRSGVGWYAALAVWLAVQPALGPADASAARNAMALEAIAGGWAAALLGGLAVWSGMTMFVGASHGPLLGFGAELMTGRPPAWIGGLSALVALAAVGGVARAWPGFRTPVLAAVAAVLALLAAVMPALGATLAVLALTLVRRRPVLATAAAVAALWIVGAFYYRLHWPLADKALLLVGCGLVLGLLWRFAARRDAAADTDDFPRATAAASPGAARAIPATLAAVLAVANFGIWQKETLIAEGRPVYFELAPVDPRSLMQGDYMRLNFRMPVAIRTGPGELAGATRPKIVARVDSRGVAEVRRRDDGAPLAADEIRVELTPKDGRWIVVSDAWFFREGDGARWQAAKYGEFRVAADGRALLVGMADKELRRIGGR